MAVMSGLVMLGGCTADKDAQMPSVSAAEKTADGGKGQASGTTGEQAVGGSDTSAATLVAAVDTSASPINAVPAISESVPADTAALYQSVPIAFQVSATVMREDIELKSTELSDLAGCVYMVPSGKGDPTTGGGGRYNLKMMRFAHFGRADSPFAFQWVLYLPNGKGDLTVRPLSKGGKKAEVTLKGGLHFDVLLKGATKPLTLRTRVTPEFKGISKNGSPNGVTLTLANGPIGFYREEYLNDTSIKAMITVTGTTFTFGNTSTKYFTEMPKIVKAELVDASGKSWKKGKVGGVKLEWAATNEDVKPIEITAYNIYRSSTPERPGSWKLIATVPASQHSMHDKEFDGSRRTAYKVTHRSSYPVEFDYEGLPTPPAIVEAVK